MPDASGAAQTDGPAGQLGAPHKESTSWTLTIRRWLQRAIPMANLLPDRQPVYVGSWVYVFGVVAIASLAWIVISGSILAIFGPQWWHQSGVGRFVNSIHLWSVEAFFISTLLHLMGQYFMAGWRDGRAKTWMVGVVIFAFAVPAAFTGYISQSNFDSEWIAIQGKDAINAAGAGSFFNPLDFGQVYGLHIILLPLLVATLVGVHILLVRMKGVVRPIESKQKTAQPSTEEAAS